MATSPVSGVPVVTMPNVQTAWHNVYDADRPMADISPVRYFKDNLARSQWTVFVSILNATGTSTATGLLEGTMDGTNFATILGFTTTPGIPVVAYTASNFPYKAFRTRVTSYTPGSATCYRVGVAATNS